MKEDKIKSACEESDQRERVERISQILEAVKYKTESERAAAIVSFSQAKLTYPEIEMLIRPLRSDYLEDQISKRGNY